MNLPANGSAKYEAAIKALFGKMDRLRKQMQRDQTDIERSQKRTQAKLAELDAMLR